MTPSNISIRMENERRVEQLVSNSHHAPALIWSIFCVASESFIDESVIGETDGESGVGAPH
jgi:hypothetical protein